MGREEPCHQISQACAHSDAATQGLPPLTCVSAFMVYTAQTLGCSAGNCVMRTLGCAHFPGLSRSGSGSRVLHKGADLLGPAFCARPRSEQLSDQVPGECRRPQLKAVTYPLPRPSHSVFWVYKGRTFSGGPWVSSGELISACDPPGGCRPSRMPRSLG